MNCGDVVLVLYPFTDASGSKVRPAIVISADHFNRSEDRILLPISSAPDKNDSHAYPITRSHRTFTQSGLKYESSIKWTKPTALSTSLIVRRLGAIDPLTISEISAKLRSIFPN